MSEAKKTRKRLSAQERCLHHVHEAIAAAQKVSLGDPDIEHWAEGLKLLDTVEAFLTHRDNARVEALDASPVVNSEGGIPEPALIDDGKGLPF